VRLLMTYSACLTISGDEDERIIVSDLERFQFFDVYLAGHVSCCVIVRRPQSLLALSSELLRSRELHTRVVCTYCPPTKK